MMMHAGIEERRGRALPGFVGLVVILVLVAIGAALIIAGALNGEAAAPIVLGTLIELLATVLAGGFVVQAPNQATVLIMLGSYRGTLREPGWWWVNPLTFGQRERISLRARSFNSATSKVNDANGNPINIAAVVVWQVVDTARAVFDVEDYGQFVVVQTETAVRHLARSYPYEAFDQEAQVLTLTGDADEVAATLTSELQARLEAAGVHVIETRLTDLSYAPEIAEAMLRRQQASAIVAARTRIVEGAVGMVRLALESLERDQVVELDEERKATMVSNLLTVLTSDHPTTPVVNVGTLAR